MDATKPSELEHLVLVVDMLDDGEYFIIVSPTEPNRLGYRVSKEEAKIIEADVGPPSFLGNNSHKHRIGINPRAACTKMQVTTIRDVIAEIPSAVDVYDEPVVVTSSRVTKAKELLASAATYPQGCSEFVCAVLGIAWEDANSVMGGSPSLIGDNNNYPGLIPGDIVGWKVGGGSGHVAVYVGESGTKFIDVREPGAKPRKVVNGYGSGRPLYKSSKY